MRSPQKKKSGMPLGRAFYRRDTVRVARDLLGKLLVHVNGGRRLAGRIVETEAYLGEGDPGSHAFRGPTPRSSVMYGEPGTAYVYFVYGNHHLLNAVTETAGKPGAVLIRALEPVEGVEIMRRRRGGGRDLTNGPGKLAQALGIDLSHNGADMTRGGLFIMDDGMRVRDIGVTGRIGLRGGGDLPLRFFVASNSHVSRKGGIQKSRR